MWRMQVDRRRCLLQHAARLIKNVGGNTRILDIR
jgi:hypothetical protein